MLQNLQGESGGGDGPARQTNYLILRTLEDQLPPALFNDVLAKVGDAMQLPAHTTWDGQQVQSTFSSLKVSEGDADAKFLPTLVRQFQGAKNQAALLAPTPQKNLNQQLKAYADPLSRPAQNLLASLRMPLGRTEGRSIKASQLDQFSRLKRAKTVFCHADFQTDEVSSIYNVTFDQTGSFVISGADDGLVKVWDRDTLMLQASLHGHSDYITDLDISKCNQFIASAGKDALVVIWELKTGKMLHKLEHHSSMINRIQFFCPHLPGKDTSSPHEQYLFSCSDDGTVRMYDFTPLALKKDPNAARRNSEEEAFRVRRSSRQRTSTESETKEPIFSLELTPDDFRPGVRNKKLDTLAMNAMGLVVAGSNTGEMFVWRINYPAVQKRQPRHECFRYLGQYKLHKNSGVQFCEFSPRAGLPNLGDYLMTGSTDGVVKIWHLSVGPWRQGERSFSMNDMSRLSIEIDENTGCRKTEELIGIDGEPAHKQVPVQAEGQIKQTHKFIKSQCEAVRWSCNGRFAICSLTSKIENQQEEECHIKIWDTVEHTYFDDLARHSGLTLRKNTWVLAAHPTMEELLMTGSDGGMLALWNLHTKQLIKQFFQSGIYSIDAFVMDNPLDGKWSPDGKAFIVGNQLGTISLFCDVNRHHQYESTRVQQFFQFDISRQNDNPFEKVSDRPQICGYNMVPYEVQPSKPLIRFEEEPLTAQEFRKRYMLSKELGRMEEKYYTDQQESGVENAQNQNVGPIEALQVSGIEAAVDVDADMEDLEMMRALEPARPQANRRVARQRLQRNDEAPVEPIVMPPVANYGSDEGSAGRISDDPEEIEMTEQQPSVGSDNESYDSETRRQPRRDNLRPRDTRRATRRQNDTPERADRNGRSTRRRRMVSLNESSDESANSSSEEEVKQPTRNRNGRFRQRNNGVSNRPSSSVLSASDSEEEQLRTRNKARRNRRDAEYSQVSPKKPTKNSYASDNEIEAEDMFLVPDQQNILQKAASLKQAKADTLYEFVKTSEQLVGKCTLCERSGSELAPFKHRETGEMIMLHRDCVESNTFSFYKREQKNWVNIGTMLKHLKRDSTFDCFRCNKPGASVGCATCGRNFHGYHCAQMYLLAFAEEVPSDCQNSKTWQCYFCRNTDNHDGAHPEGKNQSKYLAALRKIDREHLLRHRQQIPESEQTGKLTTLVPQIDDLVYYFFQGHEQFIFQNNCHFYAGQQAHFPVKQTMPWFSEPEVRNQPLVLCRVISVKVLFPSERSIGLMEQFGDRSSDVFQSPQLIHRLVLQVSTPSKDGPKFTVDMFPSDLPDFLVLASVIHSYTGQDRKELINKQVKVRTKGGVVTAKVLSENPCEPELYPNSLWQTITVEKAAVQPMQPQHRSRSRNTEQGELMRVNYWDIIAADIGAPVAFSENEHLRVLSALNTWMTKKKEYLALFASRVDEKFAKSYRSIISQEMWFDLLKRRLEGQYYRTQKQFLVDLDLVASNAAMYNGEDHEVAEDARELVKSLRIEITRCIDRLGDHKIMQQIQEAGKLTAPNRLPTAQEQEAVYEVLRRQAEPQQIDTRVRIQIEETKEEPTYFEIPDQISEVELGKRQRKDESATVEESTHQQPTSRGGRVLRRRNRDV